jgi:hypothetical protein
VRASVCTGATDDLKYDDGEYKVWRCFCLGD